jgi:hypothetical protein
LRLIVVDFFFDFGITGYKDAQIANPSLDFWMIDAM